MLSKEPTFQPLARGGFHCLQRVVVPLAFPPFFSMTWDKEVLQSQ